MEVHQKRPKPAKSPRALVVFVLLFAVSGIILAIWNVSAQSRNPDRITHVLPTLEPPLPATLPLPQIISPDCDDLFPLPESSARTAREEQAAPTTTIHLAAYQATKDALPADVTEQLYDALSELVAASIPPTYENEKNWGQTKRIYAGIKLRPEGLKLETERRWKEVNHGSWERYRVDLVDPREKLDVQLEPLQKRGDGRYEFEITLTASVKMFGRWSRWNYGVQLISLSGNADARVRLQMQGSVGLRFEPKDLVPDLIIDPQVDHATIQLIEFRLHDVSDVGGEFAQQAGRGFKHFLEDEYLPKQSERLPEKLNRKIDQKRERLRISADDWIIRWIDKHTSASK